MKIVCLVGAPSSGKTEIGVALGQKGYTFMVEKVHDLIAQGKKPGLYADESFDRELMELEFERDKTLEDKLYVFETWHPGNLAWVKLRSPNVEREYGGRLMETLKTVPVFCVMLNIDNRESLSRSAQPSKIDETRTRDEKPEWLDPSKEYDYHKALDTIRGNRLEVMKDYYLQFTVVNANKPIDEVVSEVDNIIKTVDWNAIMEKRR